MGKHPRDPLVDDSEQKQFREGRSDRLKQAPRAAEFDIGLDGETGAPAGSACVEVAYSREKPRLSVSFSQRSMPPSPSSRAIMILDAVAPVPAVGQIDIRVEVAASLIGITAW